MKRTATKPDALATLNKVGAAAPAADRSSASAGVHGRHAARQPHPRIGLYASVAILMMLLLGAAWELWRWILLAITLD